MPRRILWVALLGIGTTFLTGDIIAGIAVTIIATIIFPIQRRKWK